MPASRSTRSGGFLKKKATASAKVKADDLAPLIAEVRHLILSARRGVASVIDTFQVMTNFEIGRRIVEHEQKGEKRAAYGTELLKELSASLTEEFGQGFSERNLEYMRKFYLLWQNWAVEISQTPSAKLGDTGKPQTPSAKLTSSLIAQTASGQLATSSWPRRIPPSAYFSAGRKTMLW